MSVVAFENFSRLASNMGLRFEPDKASVANVGFSTIYKSFDLPAIKPIAGLEFRSDRQTPATVTKTVASPDTDQLAGQLFDARANAKQIAARLSMHLSGDWRGKVYRQIDELLDAADWEVGDGLLDPGSMQTFLRFVIFADVKAIPSLGMSSIGHLVAAWRRDGRRLTIEFQPADQCRMVISQVAVDDDSIVTFSGLAPPAREFLKREQFSLG